MCRFNAQFAAFWIGAINARLGFMLHDFEEANIAHNPQVNIVVTVSEKFGKRAPPQRLGKRTTLLRLS